MDKQNPFHDDAFESNPFETTEDPFLDPAVQSAAALAQHDPSPYGAPSTPAGADLMFPTATEGSKATEPSTTTLALDKISTNDPELQLMVESLRIKEAELQKREAALNDREKSIEDREANLPTDRPPNWPKCKPFIHQDIKEDIPLPFQVPVQRAYFSWWVTLLACVINMVGLLTVFVGGNPDAGGDFGISLVYVFVGIPIAFLVFRLMYNAFRKKRTTTFLLFFSLFIIEVIFDIFMLVGFPMSGACGFIHTIVAFESGLLGQGILCLISVVAWTFVAIFNILLFKTTMQVAREHGIISKAKAEKEVGEVALEVAKNNPDVVASVAKTAVTTSAAVGKEQLSKEQGAGAESSV